MIQQTMELNGIVARLERVEKENRRLKQSGIVILLGACALVLMGQAQSHRVLEAEKFVLLDNAGRHRAELAMGGAERNKPMLTFLDEHMGIPLALDGSSEPGIALHRLEAGEMCILMADKEMVGLGLYDAQSYRAGFSIQKGTPGMDLFDHNKPIPRLSLSDGPGGPELSFSHSNGDLEINLGEITSGAARGRPSLTLKDSEGYLAALGSTPTSKTEMTSAASLVLSNKEGRVLFSAP
jgi:hypothetical protein